MSVLFPFFSLVITAHLLSREYNHHVYTKASGDEASLVAITAILPELCLLIQQYFNIVDYIG
jgi:hypothetical protein